MDLTSLCTLSTET